MEMSGQIHTPLALSHWKAQGVYWIVSQVNPSASLDAVAKAVLDLAENRTTVVHFSW
jgi:hypothetical protein